MVSRCALILLLGVCLQSASCARLKRSTTQRKRAQPELVSTASSQNMASGPEPELVSEALSDETDKIHGFVVEEEARLKLYELNLVTAESDLEHERWRLKNDDKIWKFWHNRWFTDHLKGIEGEIARLVSLTASLKTSIKAAKEQISNLQDAKQWAHNATEKAKRHESFITSLHNELVAAKQQHTDTVAAHDSAQRQAKEDGDAKIQIFEAELAELTKAIEELQAELDALNNGEHDKHKDMEKARKSMQDTIAKHEELIAGAEARLVDNEGRTKQAQKNRKQSKEKFEAVLAELRADRQNLEQEVAAETSQLAAAKKDLSDSIKDKTGEIEALKTQLQKRIKELSADIENRKTKKQEQEIENSSKLLALKAEFNEEVAHKTRQINEFLAAKKDSLEALNALKNTHSEVSDGAVVSEALHKARDDLDFKLKLQEDAKATSELILERKKVEKALREAELQDADKIWKVWNWEAWSDKKRKMRAVIASVLADITAEGVSIVHSTDLINSLSTQIESKLSASKLAEVEEFAIEELEKQILEKQGEKKKVLEDEQTEVSLQKETGQDLVQTFKSMLEQLKAQRSTAASTLKELQEGVHDKHTDLKNAKATIEGIINTHSAAIQNLTAAIAVSKSSEADLQQAENHDVEDHEELITSLEADTEQLGDHKKVQEGFKQKEEEDLAKAQGDHTDDVEDLKGTLTTAIKDLDESRTDLRDSYETEKLEKDKLLELEKMKQFKDTESLKGQIDDLTKSKLEAENSLKNIKEEHLS